MTALKQVQPDIQISIRIPSGIVKIPVRGLRGSEGVSLYTDAIDGPVPKEFAATIGVSSLV